MNIPVNGVQNILCKSAITKYFTWVNDGGYA